MAHFSSTEMSLQHKRYFWLRAYAFVYLPQAAPPGRRKPSSAESIQVPPHLHVYQRPFTAQQPQQVLSNGRIVLQNHPKSELPAFFSFAVSSVVETPVSLGSQSFCILLIGTLLSLHAEMAICGACLNFPLGKVIRSYFKFYMIPFGLLYCSFFISFKKSWIATWMGK